MIQYDCVRVVLLFLEINQVLGFDVGQYWGL